MQLVSKQEWNSKTFIPAKNIAKDFSIDVVFDKITKKGAKVLVAGNTTEEGVEVYTKVAKPTKERGEYVIKLPGSMNSYVFKI